MSQRLLRCLCENCKEPAELSESQLARLRMKKVDPQNIYHAGQCKHCNQTGYFDRTAICDVMVVDKKLKAEIATNTSFLSHLRAEGAKKGQSNLRKQGMKKVLRGLTSFQELKRVVG